MGPPTPPLQLPPSSQQAPPALAHLTRVQQVRRTLQPCRWENFFQINLPSVQMLYQPNVSNQLTNLNEKYSMLLNVSGGPEAGLDSSCDTGGSPLLLQVGCSHLCTIASSAYSGWGQVLKHPWQCDGNVSCAKTNMAITPSITIVCSSFVTFSGSQECVKKWSAEMAMRVVATPGIGDNPLRGHQVKLSHISDIFHPVRLPHTS